MRFIKLVVEAFQAVARAEIDFGPGLNVLYGENDLGKSTLASAVRAALLVQPDAADAKHYLSWYADAAPCVTLTFADDDDQCWRVKKVFARGASAELMHSKDGVRFSLDCKAREVEEKLRALLRWGIPAPGGRGTRSLPVSFLANTLLAAQTDVHTILEQSLAKDADASGRLRLQKALATLAQDPLFKRVLDKAQHEVDSHFTAQGKRRRAQGSKFVAADEEVKRWLREHEALRGQLAESASIEQHVQSARAQRDERASAVANAQAALAAARAGASNARARAQAQANVEAAQAALAEIDAQAASLAALSEAASALAKRVAACEAEVASTRLECERAEIELKAAEDALRAAQTDQAEQSRKLRAAELEAEAAGLRERRVQLEARRELVRQAETACSVARQAAEAVAAAHASRQRLVGELAVASDASQQADAEVELARAVVAYGRYRALVAQVQAADESKQKASEATAQATAREAEAGAIEAQVRGVDAVLAEQRALLPAPERMEMLAQARRALEMAEAALGGGLSVAVKPRKPIDLAVQVDQQAVEHAAELAKERSFEAERTLRLTLAQLVEIEVSAGSAEQRREVEVARSRWRRECAPLLERAGVTTLGELAERVAGMESSARANEGQRVAADKLRAEARALRERAELLQNQAQRAAYDEAELAARRASIGSISHDLLDAHWEKLGRSAEAQAERLYEQKQQASATRKDELAKLQQQVHLAAHVLSGAEERARECERQAAVALHAPGIVGDAVPSELAQTIEAELARCIGLHAEKQAALIALAAEVSGARTGAERALSAARTAVERAKARHKEAQDALDTEREALNKKLGEHRAQEQQLNRLNRPAALAHREAREAELRALPDAPLASEQDVASCEAEVERAVRVLDEAAQAFFKAEGALGKVGGAQLRERLQQAEEGLKGARARERDVDLDAQAWKLLCETLRRAEDSEAAHLGRALGGPVGERFSQLTRGRYASLELGPQLAAASLQATGVAAQARVLESLSVGTRDQLATLLRLTIASQLRSAIILDDHLVHTDPARLEWFRDMLIKTALETQVVVFTCRAQDYLTKDELEGAASSRGLAGGMVRAIDLAGVVSRWDGALRKA